VEVDSRVCLTSPGSTFAEQPHRRSHEWASHLVPIHRTYSLNEVPAATRDFAQEGTLGKLGIVVAR
jgi:hypothetical protein